jgi:hypothetical protein
MICSIARAVGTQMKLFHRNLLFNEHSNWFVLLLLGLGSRVLKKDSNKKSSTTTLTSEQSTPPPRTHKPLTRLLGTLVSLGGSRLGLGSARRRRSGGGGHVGLLVAGGLASSGGLLVTSLGASSGLAGGGLLGASFGTLGLLLVSRRRLDGGTSGTNDRAQLLALSLGPLVRAELHKHARPV